MTSTPLGLVEQTQRRRAAILAFNSEAVCARINGGHKTPPQLPTMPRAASPIFDRGRYIPPSLTRIIALVAKAAHTTPAVICGFARQAKIVDCRFTVAALTEEFAPTYAAAQVDDAMNRGGGMTLWYRDRFFDRIAANPDCAALYEHCRAHMVPQ